MSATGDTASGGKKETWPRSAAYIVVDSKKCAGCLACMLACSLAHEGQASLSLSRTQIVQDIFVPYPDDLMQIQCRQCVTPQCVMACPTGACHIDTANGNVRVIKEAECNGCQACLAACPFTPHRLVWNPKIRKAAKCDLCLYTPYRREKGGPDGTQACIEACPMQARKLVQQMPDQEGSQDNEVNLRNANAALCKLDVDE